jgi:putative hydrolase
MTIREDVHVHSTYSDGKHSVEENVLHAERRGLSLLVCVDHVRADTPWVSEFTAHVRLLQRVTDLRLRSGLETKLLSSDGRLDLPADYALADRLYVADHQLPLGQQCFSPASVRIQMAEGVLRGVDVVEALITATIAAVQSYPRVVLAHLFSYLPKVGLSEADVSDRQLTRLAAVMRGVEVEVSERWRCPSKRVLSALAAGGATILASTDSHSAKTIGQYRYVHEVLPL